MRISRVRLGVVEDAPTVERQVALGGVEKVEDDELDVTRCERAETVENPMGVVEEIREEEHHRSYSNPFGK